MVRGVQSCELNLTVPRKAVRKPRVCLRPSLSPLRSSARDRAVRMGVVDTRMLTLEAWVRVRAVFSAQL